MSVSSGPLIVTNGLIFDYDMKNTGRSWKGAPTTNLVDPNWSSWTIDGSGQGNIGTRTIISPFACTISDTNSNTRQNIYINSGISASTTYSFSVKYQKLSGAPTLRFQIQAYNGSTFLSVMSFATTAQLGITDIDGWQTAKITLTTPANCNRILWFMQDGDDYTAYTHSFMLADVQCEQQSFATPFCYPSRSTTQALLDATSRSIATTGNLTYNSDNTFSFTYSSPGYVSIPLSTALNKTEGTMNFWLYPTRYNGGNGYFVNREDAVPNAADWLWIGPYSDTFYFRLGNGSDCCSNDLSFSSVSTNIPLNTWVNMCFTWKINGTSAIYKNGSLFTSRSIGNIPNTNPAANGRIGLGHSNADDYYNGIMPRVQIYNRQLSADEVLQNFNGLRGVYGL
jgi:hypothetical protein